MDTDTTTPEPPRCPSRSRITRVQCEHPQGHARIVIPDELTESDDVWDHGNDQAWEHWDELSPEAHAVQFNGSNYDAIRSWISGDPRDIRDIGWENHRLTVEFLCSRKRNLSLISGDWLCRNPDGYYMWTGSGAPASHVHAPRTIVLTALTAAHQTSSPFLTGAHHAVTVTTEHGEQLILVLPEHMTFTSTLLPNPKLGDGDDTPIHRAKPTIVWVSRSSSETSHAMRRGAAKTLCGKSAKGMTPVGSRWTYQHDKCRDEKNYAEFESQQDSDQAADTGSQENAN